MEKRIICCAECGVDYECEWNPKYPRKYCADCSQAKKASYTGTPPPERQGANIVPTEKVPMKEEATTKPKTSRTAEDITLGEDTKMAVNIFVAIHERGNNSESEMMLAIDRVKQAKDGLR